MYGSVLWVEKYSLLLDGGTVSVVLMVLISGDFTVQVQLLLRVVKFIQNIVQAAINVVTCVVS